MSIVLVCGGRDFSDVAMLDRVLRKLHMTRPFEVLIHGGARGADLMAATWASNQRIHCARVDALWDLLGRSAGPLRNAAMLKLRPDAVIAFPGGRGTASMCGLAREAGVTVIEAGTIP